MKLWDWVRYCGGYFRVCNISCGQALISDGIIYRRVSLSVLEPVDIEVDDDPYPED